MSITTTPTAVHLGAEEIPFVDMGGGNLIRVLQVREKESLWIIENVFQAGFEVPTHRHTGPVWGYTSSGAWKYKEYEYVNRAGSFLYEPANSVHTLHVPEDNDGPTDVLFVIEGALLNLTDDDAVETVFDGQGAVEAYFALLEAAGMPRPNGLILK